MASVKHRTIEEDIFDGSSGEKVQTKTIHQLGVEIDGVFCPFISKEGSYFDRLVKDGKAAQQAQAKSAPKDEAPAETDTEEQ